METNQNSLLAYKLMQPKIPNDQESILAVLEINPDQTYCEIAKLLRFQNPNKVSRRIPELIRSGKVEISGSRTCTIAKSKCSTYRLKT